MMKKHVKIWLIVALVLLLTGIGFASLGMILGAKKYIRFDTDGLKMLSGEESVIDYTTDEIKDIDEIKIDVSDMCVEFLPSDNDNYKVEYKAEYGQTPEISVDGSLLRVEQKMKPAIVNLNFNIFNWISEPNVVRVYVPADAKLKNIYAKSSNGHIYAKQNLAVDDFEIYTSNGRIEIDGLTCNKAAKIKTSNGRIECNGTFYNSTNMHTSNGRVNISGKFYGNTEVKTSNGRIEAAIEGSDKDYDIDADTSSGKVTVNQYEMSDRYKINNGADNSLNLKSSNGSIIIKFNK